MATVQHNIVESDGWVEVVGSGDDTFILENRGTKPVKLTFADSAPAADAAFHWLNPNQAMIRLSSGAVYIAVQGEDTVSQIIASK